MAQDPKIIRMIVRLRKMDASARREQEDLFDCYKAAIGMADWNKNGGK